MEGSTSSVGAASRGFAADGRHVRRALGSEVGAGFAGGQAVELAVGADVSLAGGALGAGAGAGAGARALGEAYEALEGWVFGSLEMWRDELCGVLWPVLVTFVLDLLDAGAAPEAAEMVARFRQFHSASRRDELAELGKMCLASSSSAEAAAATGREAAAGHKAFEEYALLRGNKFRVALCEWSFELLVNWVRSRGTAGALVSRVLTERVALIVRPGLPSRGEGPAEVPQQLGLGGGGLGAGEGAGAAAAAAASASARDAGAGVGEKKGVGAAAAAMAAAKEGDAEAAREDAAALEAAGVVQKDGLLYLGAGTGRVGPECDVCMLTLCNMGAQGVTCAAVNPEGTLVAAGLENSTATVFDLCSAAPAGRGASDGPGADEAGGAPPQPPPPQQTAQHLCGHHGRLTGLDFSSCSEYLLTSSLDSSVKLWFRGMGWANLATYPGYGSPFMDVCFAASNNRMFATCGFDRTARLWSTDRTVPLRIFVGHLSEVTCAAFHPNATTLISGGGDKTVRVWDVLSGACARVLVGHTRAITSLSVNPDGKTVATGDEGGTVMVWDIGSGKRIGPSLDFAPAPPLADRSGWGSGMDMHWGPDIASSPWGGRRPGAAVYSLAHDALGKRLGGCGADGTVRVWGQGDFGQERPLAEGAAADVPASKESAAVFSSPPLIFRSKCSGLRHARFIGEGGTMLVAGVL